MAREVDDVVRQTLRDLKQLLKRRSAPYAVIGGIAVAIRGEPRFTADIDAVVGIDIAAAVQLARALRNSAFLPLFPDIEEVVKTACILPMRHRKTRIQVDLVVGLTGFEQQAIQRAEDVRFGRLSLRVITAEDLLLMKVLAGRPRDLDDTERIVAKQGKRLDWSYVFETAKQLEEVVAQDLVGPLEALQRKVEEDLE